MVLLVLLTSDLQFVWVGTQYESAGMKIGTCKSETMVLRWRSGGMTVKNVSGDRQTGEDNIPSDVNPVLLGLCGK